MIHFIILTLFILSSLSTAACSQIFFKNSSDLINKNVVQQGFAAKPKTLKKIIRENEHLETQELISQATFENETKCVDETIELKCNRGQRIIVDTITFGKSKTCDHRPWPTGCLRHNYHFHPCTGLQICSVKAPVYDIRLCGLSDYVHMEYRCIEASSIYDICDSDNKNQTLSATSGFISTPGYPTAMGTLLNEPSCAAYVDLIDDYRIKVFIVDSTTVGASHNVSKQCLLYILITDLSAGVLLKTTNVCLEKVYFRNEMIFESSSNQIKIEVYADDTILNDKTKKGLLLYYQAFHNDRVDGKAHERAVTLGRRVPDNTVLQTTTIQDYQFVYYKYNSGKTTEFDQIDDLNTTRTKVNISRSLETNWHGINLEMTIGFIIGGVVLATLLLVLVIYLCKHCTSSTYCCHKRSTQLQTKASPPKKDVLGDLAHPSSTKPSETQNNYGYENHAFIASVMGTSTANLEESIVNQVYSKECLGENMEIYLENDYSVSESPTIRPLDNDNHGTCGQLDGGPSSTDTGESDMRRRLSKGQTNTAVVQYENELFQNRVNDWVANQVSCPDAGNLNETKPEDNPSNIGKCSKVEEYNIIKVPKSNNECDIDEGIILDQEEMAVIPTGHNKAMSKCFTKKTILGPQVLPVNNMYDLDKLPNSSSADKMHPSDTDMKSLHYVSIQHLEQNMGGSLTHLAHTERHDNKTVYSSIDFQKSKQLQQKVVESFLKSQYAKSNNGNPEQAKGNDEYEVPVSVRQLPSDHTTAGVVIQEKQWNHAKLHEHNQDKTGISCENQLPNTHTNTNVYLSESGHDKTHTNVKKTKRTVSEDCKYKNGQTFFPISDDEPNDRKLKTNQNKPRKYAAPPPPVEPPPEEEELGFSPSYYIKRKPGLAPKPILRKGTKTHN